MQPSRQSSFRTIPSPHKCKWWLCFLAKSTPRPTLPTANQFQARPVERPVQLAIYLPSTPTAAQASSLSPCLWLVGRWPLLEPPFPSSSPPGAVGSNWDRHCFLGSWALTCPRFPEPAQQGEAFHPMSFSLLLPWMEAMSLAPT